MFEKNDRVYLNDPRNTHHGQPGTIVDVDIRNKYPYQVQLDGDQFAFWYPESLLSPTPIQSIQETAKSPVSLPQSNQSPYDFDKLGVGIGGINRYQPTAAEEMELIDAQIRHMEREEHRVRRGPLPHGQLWEPCPICGNEPVCLDCGLCEKHCDC